MMPPNFKRTMNVCAVLITIPVYTGLMRWLAGMFNTPDDLYVFVGWVGMVLVTMGALWFWWFLLKEPISALMPALLGEQNEYARSKAESDKAARDSNRVRRRVRRHCTSDGGVQPSPSSSRPRRSGH